MSSVTAAELKNVPATEALPFAYVPAKVLVPAPRPGSIVRAALVNRLRAARGFPLVTLVAMPGSGKTTVLAQWALRDERPFAWVSIDDRDNDPLVLLRHLAVALDCVSPLDRAVLNTLRSRTRSLWTSAVPRLAAALSSLESPFVLVLDDASRLVSRSSLDIVSLLVDHMPLRSTLALAGRSPIGLSTASLRAQGRLCEIDGELVSLNTREAEDLLRATSIRLDDGEISKLVERCEGWAAGLYLSALAIRDGAGDDAQPAGDDRYLADYFRSECLAAHSDRQLAFLSRTSILETLSAPLCDAVLGRSDSARELATIGASNLFVVPLDRSSRSYRCHPLLRDLLRRELEREAPELIAPMHELAADWFEANRAPEAAIDHAAATGDADRVATLVATLGVPGDAECAAAVERWLHVFDDAQLERYPRVAVLGAWAHARSGRTREAKRWLEIAERSPHDGPLPDGVESLQVCIVLLRAAMCEDGVETMLSDAEAALAGLRSDSRCRPIALLLHGAALALLGASDRADEALARAAETGESIGAVDAWLFALTERSLLAAARGDHTAVDQLGHDAERVVSGSGAGRVTADVLSVAILARTLLRRGRADEARAELATARALAPSVPKAFPWLFVQTHLELARALLTLHEARAAQSEIDRAGEILSSDIALGILHDEASMLQRNVDDLRTRAGNDVGLTPAELRIVPLLASHLSFPEIAARFCVSRNTIKTQAMSIYRKLGVASRGEAIQRANRLGLLDLDGAYVRS